MTKLAIYDQKYGERDRKDNEYYRHDYIYRKNMWTRFCAGIAGIIMLLLYWMYQIFALGVKVLEVDYRQAGIDAAIFFLFIMAIYTVLGTIREAREYAIGQRRLKNYMRMLYILDRTRESKKVEEGSSLYHGVDVEDTRSNNPVV
jgi:Na+/proline symporter